MGREHIGDLQQQPMPNQHSEESSMNNKMEWTMKKEIFKLKILTWLMVNLPQPIKYLIFSGYRKEYDYWNSKIPREFT